MKELMGHLAFDLEFLYLQIKCFVSFKFVEKGVEIFVGNKY